MMIGKSAESVTYPKVSVHRQIKHSYSLEFALDLD